MEEKINLSYIDFQPEFPTDNILVIDNETELSIAGNCTPFVVVSGFHTRSESLSEIFKAFRSNPGCFFVDYGDSTSLLVKHEKDSICVLEDIFLFCLQENYLILNQTLEYDLRGLFNQYGFLMETILQLYKNSQCSDLTVREKLLDIATGRARKLKKRYSLDELTAKYLNVVVDKRCKWRRHYKLLKHLPINQWPESALEYLLEDIKYIIPIYKAQRENVANPTYIGSNASIWERPSKSCYTLNDEYRQSRYDFVLNCAASMGMFKNWNHIKQFYGTCKENYQKLLALRKSLGIVRCSESPSFKAFCESINILANEEPAARLVNASLYEGLFAKLIYIFEGDKNIKDFGTGRSAAREAVIEYCCSLVGKIPQRTPSGKVATGKDILKDVGDPLLNLLIVYAFHEYSLTSIIPALFKGTHVMTSRVDVLKITGRLSWKKSKQDGINFTGIARDFGPRQCFCAEPGEVLDTSDFSSVELCAISQHQYVHLNSSRLGDFINNGISPELRTKDPSTQGDAHMAASCAIRHEDIEEIKSIYSAKEYSGFTEETLKARKAEIKENRQVGKMINFGVWGGMGPEKLAISGLDYNVKVSTEEAKQIIEIVKTQFPEYGPYFRLINNSLVLGYEENINGKPIKVGYIQLDRSKRIRQGNYTELSNYCFQGLAADGGKAAFFHLFFESFVPSKEFPNLFGTRPKLMIHDEILSSGPKETVSKWSEQKTDIMFEVMKSFLPRCPSAVDPAVCFVWDKNAKEKRENGLLIPCDKEPVYLEG